MFQERDEEMKRILSVFFALIFCIHCTACTNKDYGSSQVELAKDVNFSLTDVWEIKNTESNTMYYYYFAIIENNSKKQFDMNNLSFKIKDKDNDTITGIDQETMSPSYMLEPKQSTFVYGYIGYPDSQQKNVGIQFEKPNVFVSFHSIDLRSSTDQDIVEKGKKSFTLFEDDALRIDVNAKNTKTLFENGTTKLSDFQITYTNKTDSYLVIPYLQPKAVLNGLNLTKYSDKGNFKEMSEKEFKKIDFTKDGMPPKTEDMDSEATGYVVYYLNPEQILTCNIEFTFQNAGIDYADENKDVFDIQLISSAFGSTTTLNISYE